MSYGRETRVTKRLIAGRTISLLLSVVSLSVTVAGCGGKRTTLPTGTVSGTITFNGEPVSEGFVNFISTETGQGETVALGSGGEFAFTEPVVIGPYAVFVTPPEGEPPTVENPTPAPPDPKNIPKKYRTDATTDFKVEVQEGKNEFTLDMKPE